MIRNILLTTLTLSMFMATGACSDINSLPFKPTSELSSLSHSRRHTVWHKIRRDMEMPDAEYRPEVQRQIAWYQNNKHYLNEIMQSSAPYINYIYQQTKKQGVPAEMALMPMVESDYNPFAFSQAGATGLWQMMPGTASGFGLKINWWYDGRRDIEASTEAAFKYLNYLHSFFKDRWLLAVAAYDCGEGRVQRALHKNKRNGQGRRFWSLPLPQETQDYLPKLLAVKAIIKHPKKYGFELPDISGRPFLTKVNVGSQIDLAEAARLADVDLQTMRDLNPGYRRWATDPDGPYTLMIPKSKANIFKERLAKLPKKKRVTWRRYTVKSGDALSSIANKFNTRTRIIKKVNKLKSNVLNVGQNLLIPVAYHGSVNSPVVKHKRAIEETEVPGPKRHVYTVKPGDSLWNIAAKFNVSTGKIEFWNNLSYHQKLQPGSEIILWLDNKHAKHHTASYHVKPGDTLGGLSERYNTTVSQLRKANHLKGDTLHIGQKLVIPLDTDRSAKNEQTNQPPVQMTRGKGLRYEVQSGDTLSEIAHRFGVSLKRLKKANGLEHHRIQDGHWLTIPDPHNQQGHWTSYTVKKGDYLRKIAQKFRTKTDKIRQWNLLSDNDYIHPQEKLVVFKHS